MKGVLLAVSLCATVLLGAGYCLYENNRDEDEEKRLKKKRIRSRNCLAGAHLSSALRKNAFVPCLKWGRSSLPNPTSHNSSKRECDPCQSLVTLQPHKDHNSCDVETCERNQIKESREKRFQWKGVKLYSTGEKETCHIGYHSIKAVHRLVGEKTTHTDPLSSSRQAAALCLRRARRRAKLHSLKEWEASSNENTNVNKTSWDQYMTATKAWAKSVSYDSGNGWNSHLMVVKRVTYQCIA